MNNKMRFALLTIGLIASLGIATSDCINLRTLDKNGAGISGARVYLEAVANFVGETNSVGYLRIPLDNLSLQDVTEAEANDHVWNITTTEGSKRGYAMVTVPAGTCQNLTIPMIY